MKKINKSKKGFSLIELMMAIAMISIMTAVTLASMNTQREKKAVESAAREVAATLREAQNYALTGKGLIASSTICSYIFSWTEGAGYRLTGCKTQNYTLKDRVKFGNTGSVSFSVPFSIISPIGTKDIALSRGASSYHVCIYSSGVVSEKADGCL